MIVELLNYGPVAQLYKGIKKNIIYKKAKGTTKFCNIFELYLRSSKRRDVIREGEK